MTERTTTWPTAPAARRLRYWAFISYSRIDTNSARSLHRRLEAYSIPRSLRQQLSGELRYSSRLRPVFRDMDEMPASGVLDDRLHCALDESGTLIVVASPTAAASRYVNLEVDHFVATRGMDHVVTVVVAGEPGGPPDREPIPGALRSSGRLWVEGRRRRRLSRHEFLRIVAHVLGVEPDVLARRDARRRRRRVFGWLAGATALLAVTGGIFWQQNRIAEERRHAAEQRAPEQQQHAFEQFLRTKLFESNREVFPDSEPRDVTFDILRTDDLNGDGLIDYFVHNTTPAFCGSAGCSLEVYITAAPGAYTHAFTLLGSSTPRTRETGTGGTKEILTTDNWISGQPLYTIHRWDGQAYKPAHYEFCDGVSPEACDPLVITPLDPAGKLVIASGAVFRERPDPGSRPVTVGARGSDVEPPDPTVIGVLPDGKWYLVNVWKGSSGFVEAQAVHQGPG